MAGLVLASWRGVRQEMCDMRQELRDVRNHVGRIDSHIAELRERIGRVEGLLRGLREVFIPHWEGRIPIARSSLPHTARLT